MDQIFCSAVFYKDPSAALDWLAEAFGFERTMLITNAEGSFAHSEMSFGDGYIMVGAEWASWTASPANIGGNVWTFAQTVKTVSRAQTERETGYAIEAPTWK